MNRSARLPGLFQSRQSQNDRSNSTNGATASGMTFNPNFTQSIQDTDMPDLDPFQPPVQARHQYSHHNAFSFNARTNGNSDTTSAIPQAKEASQMSSTPQHPGSGSTGRSTVTPPALAPGGSIDQALQTQRDRSRKFILDWHRHGYTYEQLISEGMDPAFLKPLYHDVGIPIPTPSDMSIKNPKSTPKQNSVLNITSPTMTSHPSLPPKPTFAPDLSKSSFAASYGKIAELPPKPKTQSPMPTREDYIARLMAAKTKKAETQASASRSQTPSAAIPTLPNPQGSELKATATTPQATPQVDESTTAGSLSTFAAPTDGLQTVVDEAKPLQQSAPNSADIIAEAKRRAKTALARERMAAMLKGKSMKSAAVSTPAQSQALQSDAPPRHQQDFSHGTSRAVEGKKTDIAATSSSASPSITTGQVPQNSTPSELPTPSARKSSFAGRIPGLFLTSSEPTPEPSMSQTPDVILEDKANAESVMAEPEVASLPERKRSISHSSAIEAEPPTKRPARLASGVAKEDAMVIDSSDGEPSPPLPKYAIGSSSPMNGGILDKAATKAQQKALARPELSHSVSSKQDQIRKQREILEMKKKIATMELKRRQARLQASGNATPTSKARPPEPGTPHLGDRLDLVSKAATSQALDAALSVPSLDATTQQATKSIGGISRESLVDSHLRSADDLQGLPLSEVKLSMDIDGDATVLSAKPDTTALPIDPLPETKRLDGVGPNDSHPAPDSHAQRRLEIQSGLPVLEANFVTNTGRLEALRLQMQELEDVIRKEQEDKQRLTAELTRLGIDTEGKNHVELQEIKEEIKAQAAPSGTGLGQSGGTSEAASQRPDDVHPPANGAAPDLFDDLTAQSTGASMSMSSPEEVMSDRRGSETGLPDDTHAQTLSGNDFPTHPVEDHSSDDGIIEEESDAAPEQDADPPIEQLEDTNDPNHPLNETQSDGSLGDISMDEESDAGSDGSASDSSNSMSVVGEDVHQRDESAAHTAMEEDTTFHGQDDGQVDDESDFYEPPDADELPASTRPESLASGAQSASAVRSSPSLGPPPAPKEAAIRGDESMDEGLDDDDDYDPADPLPPLVISSAASNASAHEVRGAAEAQAIGGPNMQSATTSKIISLTDDELSDAAPQTTETFVARPGRHFTPYQSAIRSFRNYRLLQDSAVDRPRFDAPAIDPQNPWCRFEAAGGVCNDPQCDYQHIRSMAAEDETLPARIGLSTPDRSP